MTPIEKEEAIKELVVGGLLTDGTHHKQWYFEEILKVLVPNYNKFDFIIDNQLQDYDWEDGIAP